jgi:putative ABC transport system substrate-binding protein
VKRRTFIVGLGSAAALPVVARAQQGDRMRRIGVLIGGSKDDPVTKPRLAAFWQALAELGWAEGRNLRIDNRYAAGDRALLPKYATELVGLKPDVILANGGGSVRPLEQASRTVPIVFAEVIDPVGGGYVESLALPGGNDTGFTSFEYSFAGKWLELLKQIAPGVTRAAVLRDPAQFAGVAQLGVIQAVAPSHRVVVSPLDVREPDAIERSITVFARGANGGLIVPVSFLASIYGVTIITLAARHRIPAVYSAREFVAAGGLVSYGPNLVDQYRQAAGYVDRILKGEKPADLPVQAPSKYETVINLKTAKALGLTIPETLLATADEVIQ